MLDPALECAIIGFQDDDVHMAGVVIDQRLPQWRAIGGGQLGGLRFLDR